MTCGCRKPSCRQCSSFLPATPAPYYQCTPSCQEDNTLKVINNFYSYVLKIPFSWNIPSCGHSATFKVDGVQNILVGSNIWNPNYGYFEVVFFDYQAQTLTVQNNCLDGNQPEGTQVPACSDFAVTPPPCCADTGNLDGVFVALDFTAPDVGDCIPITLTSEDGLAIGRIVQIGSGRYRISDIQANNVINICNDGDGLVPGTPVIAKDAAGNYQYPVVLTDLNPCAVTNEVTEGKLQVCASGNPGTLSGAVDGAVPVLIDAATGNVQFQNVDLPTRLCTALTADLGLIPATASYTMTVGSTTGFNIGDVLQIDSRADRVTLTLIDDATHMTGTFDPVPAAFETITSGTAVCQVLCCEDLQHQIDCIQQSRRITIPGALYTGSITMSLDEGGIFETIVDSDVLEFEADDSCPDAVYHVRAEINVAGLVNYQSSGMEAVSVISSEIQADWDNNVGTGGRFNFTDYAPDGFDVDGPGDGYPPTSTLNAIWPILYLAVGKYPIMYHSSTIIADTAVNAGDTITLRLNYKAITGENYSPEIADVFGYGIYIIGNLVITRL